MLHSIRRSAALASTQGPAEMLLECHARMRTFLDFACRVTARSTLSPDDEIACAAASLVRYFTIALPLHEQDEEISVAPVLASSGLLLAADRMSMMDGHGHTRAILASVIPVWDRLKREPQHLRVEAAPLHERTVGLRDWLYEHLAMEELHIVPLLARLPEITRAAMFDEMRARREAMMRSASRD